MDGDMVAAFLADRAIGTDNNGKFQPEAFKSWVVNLDI
jgi:hypothetical protein